MANDEESIQKRICIFSSARKTYLFMRIGSDGARRRIEPTAHNQLNNDV